MKICNCVIGTIIIFLVLVPFILMWLISIQTMQKKKDYKVLSEEFVPIFEDVNNQLYGKFSYETACYSCGGGLKEFSLTFLGDNSEFTECSLEFCNLFSKAMASGEYSTYRLNGEYVLRIKNSEMFLNCWYNASSSSLTASTNATDNSAAFEALLGIWKLTVVTNNFTEEQKEYAKSFQDKCSFEVVLSDNIPW